MRQTDLKERLQALAAFLPQFEAPDFEFGTWVGGGRSGSGALTFPAYVTSATADAFVQACYDHGWVLEDFAWPAWKQTPEAEHLRDDPAALAEATPEQLAQLLTVCIRQDRFSEGELAAHFQAGLLTSILRRATALADSGEDGADT